MAYNSFIGEIFRFLSFFGIIDEVFRLSQLWLKSQKHLSHDNFSHLLTFFLRLRLSNGVFIPPKNLSGGCHNEVGAPKMGLNEAHGLCPDAPGFLNLIPGIWTGDHPPTKILYPAPFKGQGYFY